MSRGEGTSQASACKRVTTGVCNRQEEQVLKRAGATEFKHMSAHAVWQQSMEAGHSTATAFGSKQRTLQSMQSKHSMDAHTCIIIIIIIITACHAALCDQYSCMAANANRAMRSGKLIQITARQSMESEHCMAVDANTHQKAINANRALRSSLCNQSASTGNQSKQSAPKGNRSKQSASKGNQCKQSTAWNPTWSKPFMQLMMKRCSTLHSLQSKHCMEYERACHRCMLRSASKSMLRMAINAT
eukprot:1149165-Pelagomonas_calceolata.AAC.3